MIKLTFKIFFALVMMMQISFASARPEARGKAPKEVKEALKKARENVTPAVLNSLVKASKLSEKEVKLLLEIDSGTRIPDVAFTKEFRDSTIHLLAQSGVRLRAKDFYAEMAKGIKELNSVEAVSYEKKQIITEAFGEAVRKLSEVSGDASKSKKAEDLALAIRLLSTQGKDFLKSEGESSFFDFVVRLKKNNFDVKVTIKEHLKETNSTMTEKEFLEELKKRCLK